MPASLLKIEDDANLITGHIFPDCLGDTRRRPKQVTWKPRGYPTAERRQQFDLSLELVRIRQLQGRNEILPAFKEFKPIPIAIGRFSQLLQLQMHWPCPRLPRIR